MQYETLFSIFSENVCGVIIPCVTIERTAKVISTI